MNFRTELHKSNGKANVAIAKMKINLPDGSWDLEVFLGLPEPGHEDNVLLRLTEECPESTRMLRANQIMVGITATQARELARCLTEAAAEVEMAEEKQPAKSWNKPKTASAQKHPMKQRRPFTEKQGRYLAFIHRYQQKYLQSPAESDIQRHFLVEAPTVNQMVQRLERLGLIARTPGQARSIRLLVPTELLQTIA